MAKPQRSAQQNQQIIPPNPRLPLKQRVPPSTTKKNQNQNTFQQFNQIPYPQHENSRQQLIEHQEQLNSSKYFNEIMLKPSPEKKNINQPFADFQFRNEVEQEKEKLMNEKYAAFRFPDQSNTINQVSQPQPDPHPPIQPQNPYDPQQILQLQNLFQKYYQQQYHLSFMWIFIIEQLNPQIQHKLKQLRENVFGHDNHQKLIPYCSKADQAQIYFQAQNCLFNVVADLVSAENLIQLIHQNKIPEDRILSIQLYNNQGTDGIYRACKIKESFKKVRGFENDLTEIIKRAEIDLTDGTVFEQDDGHILPTKSKKSNLPTLIVLNKEDKSEISLYRINEYGAINLQNLQDKKQKFKDFVDLVDKIYSKNKTKKQTEMKNLQNYKNIHKQLLQPTDKTNIQPIKQPSNAIKPSQIATQLQAKHKQILNFYTKQTFYHHLTNNLLRFCRTVEQFRPVMLPFHQNYHALKYFYDKDCKNHQNKRVSDQPLELYRGTTMKYVQFIDLKKGDYVEMLGFVSASKSEQRAREFARKVQAPNMPYLFIFEIPNRKIPDKLKVFDHGYVYLNQYHIPDPQFVHEEEVLINALNIFQVRSITKPQDTPDGIGLIRLRYGAIIDLYQKSQKNLQQMTREENNVLLNCRWCLKEKNQIRDTGDILMKTHQYAKCQQYLQKQNKNCPTPQNFNRLAEVLFKQGQPTKAIQNAKQSMKLYQSILDNKDPREIKSKKEEILKVQDKNAQIFKANEDILNAKKAIDFQLKLTQMLDGEKEWLLKAEIHMKRAEISFKEGNTKEAQQGLRKSENIILTKMTEFQSKKDQISWNYTKKRFLGCLTANNQDLQQLQQDQLSQLNEKYSELVENKTKIQKLLININQMMRQLAKQIGDNKWLKQCSEKAKQYVANFTVNQKASTTQHVQSLITKAKLQNSSQQDVQKSFQTLEKAIEILKDDKSPIKGELNNLFGMMKKDQLIQTILLPSNQNDENKRTKKFDQSKYRQIYQDSKKKFSEALNVTIQFKGSNDPSVFQIRNHLGQVQLHKSQFRKAIEQALQVLGAYKSKASHIHSQIAKSALIISKSYLEQGQILMAFQKLQESHQLLEKALKKTDQKGNCDQEYDNQLLAKAIQKTDEKAKQDDQYENIFKMSPVYMEIQLWKCKIYNRQMARDLHTRKLAQQTIVELLNNGEKKLKNVDGVGYLADIYQVKGFSYFYRGKLTEFIEYTEKAINLRKNEMGGKYNIKNAFSLCMMAQYLIPVNALQHAQQYIHKAAEIFSRYPNDHPYKWILWSAIGQYYKKISKYDQEQKYIRESVKLIEKRYEQVHIHKLKMQLREAQMLMKRRKFEEAKKKFQLLKELLGQDESVRNSLIYQQNFNESSPKQDQPIHQKEIQNSKQDINKRSDMNKRQHGIMMRQPPDQVQQIINKNAIQKSRINALEQTEMHTPIQPEQIHVEIPHSQIQTKPKTSKINFIYKNQKLAIWNQVDKSLKISLPSLTKSQPNIQNKSSITENLNPTLSLRHQPSHSIDPQKSIEFQSPKKNVHEKQVQISAIKLPTSSTKLQDSSLCQVSPQKMMEENKKQKNGGVLNMLKKLWNGK